MKVWLAVSKTNPDDVHVETEDGREVPAPELFVEYDGDLVLIGPIEWGEAK